MREKGKSILTLNGGSSSIKFSVYQLEKELVQELSGNISKIGSGNAVFTLAGKSDKKTSIKDFDEAVTYLTNWIEKKISFSNIAIIGHRFVHGLNHREPILINETLLLEIGGIANYDPEHLPAEIKMAKIFAQKYPQIPQAACFDTAFHASLPELAFQLPLPRIWTDKGLRKYGFHGLSYSFLMEEIKNKLGNKAAKQRIILAHLGSGASLAAIKNGTSVDTSMGFTPTGGIMMSTRTGDLDPGVSWFLMENNMTASEFSRLVNHESGLLGVSGSSSDMQKLLKEAKTKKHSALAIDLFCYQVKKTIGAYIAVLGGLDILVFSGGIGEHAAEIRTKITEGLKYAGLTIDEKANGKNAFQISKKKSIKVLVITTNEEIMIARGAAGLLSAHK